VQVVDGARGDAAGARITFDPTILVPTISVVPATQLPYRGYVTVTAHHVTPGAFTAFECFGRGSCGPETSGTADAAGNLVLRVVVRRIGFFVDEDGAHPVDCAATGGCRIQLEPASGNDSERLSAFLTFDPAAPVPPPPTIRVTPATGLAFRSVVHVTGAGFLATGDVVLAGCTAGTVPPRCSRATTVAADTSGRIDTQVTVQRTLSDGLSVIDCAERIGRCVLRAQPPGVSDAAERATADLGFDPNTTAPPGPPVRVQPSTALTDGQTVQVSGSGFAPRANLGIAMCSAVATFSLLDCDIANPTFFPADAAGAFTHAYAVRAHLTTAHGAIDCTTGPGVCSIAVVSTDDYTQFTKVPVSFGPLHNDRRPIMRIRSTTVREGNATTTVRVPVTLDHPSLRDVSVEFVTHHLTARAGDDYVRTRGTLVIPRGQTTGFVRVHIVGDRMHERSEQFLIDLDDAVHARIDDGEAFVTIHDDD
jgi:hypothetical protein